jgi:arylsulfatase A-like enzyme
LNVLLITADQWRGDCLGALHHPVVHTPNLDRLARDGVLFARHFAQATPCGPSRASLYTGMYAFNHRSIANGTPLDARHSNLALEAKKAGYAPVLFGYTDTSADPRGRDPGDPWLFTYEGILPGFEAELYLPEHAGPWLDRLRDAGYPEVDLAWAYGGPLGEPAPFGAEDSETAFLAERFLAWLEGRGNEPWLAHVSFLKPHSPTVAAAPFHALHDPAAVPPPERAPTREAEAALHPWLAYQLEKPLGASWWGKPADHDEATIRKLRAVYYGLIAELDHHLGRIVERLRERGDLDRTLVVFTSDHGEMLGDHWLLAKDGFFPEAFHVPLIVRDPLLAGGRGRVVRAFTEHVDLMPTVLERIGVLPPLQCDGRSLAPFLRGEPRPVGWRDAAHYEHDFRDLEHERPGRALGLAPDLCQIQVRHGERYSYVHFNGLPPLCFDRAQDPHLRRDIVADPARAPEVLAQAQALLGFRMTMAERRLTGCLLTEQGPIGRY